jgi:hypothetical protein
MNERRDRFKTGDEAEIAGTYMFDGYTDGTSDPPPTDEESMITLDENDTFPPLRSSRKGAWWRLQPDQGVERDDDPGSEGEDQGRDQEYEGSE